MLLGEPGPSTSKEPEKTERKEKVDEDPFAFYDFPSVEVDEEDLRIDEADNDEDFLPDKVQWGGGAYLFSSWNLVGIQLRLIDIAKK